MPDTYIDLAVKALRYHKAPLSAKEIMKIADEIGAIPPHTHGKTQHKTLQARLSEHILRDRENSLVYRVSPGRFFLREFMLETSIDDKFKIEFHARRRKKDLTNENVLVLPAKPLKEAGVYGYIDDTNQIISLLKKAKSIYKPRKNAETDFNCKQIITYVLVAKGSKILSYRRGKFSNAGQEILGARSVGFGGHVSDTDADFLDQETFGIRNNASRELLEELWLEREEQMNLQKSKSLRLFSFINVDDTEEAKKHIAAILLYYCTPKFEPKKGELSINDLNWLDITHRPNNLDDFELWSRIIINKLRDPKFRKHFGGLKAG